MEQQNFLWVQLPADTSTLQLRRGRHWVVPPLTMEEHDVSPHGLHASQQEQRCTEVNEQERAWLFQVTGSACQLQNILLGVIYPKYKLVADGRPYSNCFFVGYRDHLYNGPRAKHSYVTQNKSMDPRITQD